MFEDYHNPNDYWMQRPQPGEQPDPDEAFKAGCFGAIFYIAALVVGMLICLLFGSCKSVEYVFVPQTHTDTLIQTKVVHDSIRVKDSTHVSEKQNGDTVLIEREKWHTKFVYRDVHDTLYVSKTDTIPHPYPVEKEVPAELTWWQQTRLHIANILLWALLVVGVVWLAKLIIKKYLP